MRKLISWNLNGIRAAVRHGLVDFTQRQNADIYCFQELKIHQQHSNILKNIRMSGYHGYWHFAQKKGYSGVAVFTKKKPLKVICGLDDKKIDDEGRVVTLEYPNFYLINAYFPHAGRELKRLDFKLYFNQKFLAFTKKLQPKKLIIAGDFNVAHQEIDLANPKQNQGNAMFTKEERTWMDRFLRAGFVDSFRLYCQDGGHYTWWPWRNNCRRRNIGWRIDYFLISAKLKSKIVQANILNEVYGSDHCPIELKINL